MPTENRSSNTEMVSVPRELAERIQLRLDHAASAFKVAKPERDQFRTLLAKPAPQPQAEPIAWMVGTAFWWTKEEAERDAAATGLPIVGLGPMVGQHQGEPVAAFKNCIDARAYIADLFKQRLRRHDFNQYITERLAGDFAYALANWLAAEGQAHPAEVERLRSMFDQADADLRSVTAERDTLCAQLAESQALLREAACHATRMEPMSASCLNRIDTVLDRKA